MKRTSIWVSVVLGLAALCFAVGISAAEKSPDVITMKKDFKDYEYTKGIVEFSHKKHYTEYAEKAPDLYESKCGVCHHDENGKPLTDLKEGDSVQECRECHSKPGEVPRELKKEWRAKKIDRKEQAKKSLEWHAEAVHESCTPCHKDYNRATKTKDAPTTCTKCHPKEG